ncbi:hypothetical protein AM1_6073 [Acaryochloris marina MBIC11017]|uniref:PsbP C-terminal domain-containing protein n=2 Tax=Acaryochloris marina TaxID=155978 RepID=B0C3R8_ACAM1|nr:hypothetical protein AM1_6073 [Acaryochloris marina MBIC11017]
MFLRSKKIIVVMLISIMIFSCRNIDNKTVKYKDINFQIPSSWQSEALNDVDGLLVINSVSEEAWQANVFFEFRRDSENRSLKQSLSDLSRSLKEQKKNFQRILADEFELDNGINVGRLEYTHQIDHIQLHSWELIFRLNGRTRLFVAASAESSLWERDRQVFDKIIQSINVD